MKTVNSYLIKDPVPTLIDCGEDSDDVWAALKEGLKNEHLKFRDIRRIVITHAHVDHMGMTARLANESGADVWLNDKCLEWGINIEENWARRGQIMQKTITAFFRPEMIQTMKDGFISVNEKIKTLWKPIQEKDVKVYSSQGTFPIDDDEWQVLYMPGHSNTQTCFYNPVNKYLLSADMLLKITPTPVIEEDEHRPGHRSKGLATMIESYKRLQSFDIDKVFPGHYEVFGNAREVMSKQLARIDMRKKQCLDILQDGGKEIFELYGALYGPGWNFPAFNMLIGYLDLLDSEGKVIYNDDGEVRIIEARETRQG